ncbi:MAG: hypothetical protein HY280_03035 [Nitrospinae bacterium]|nr:hypothetical protein [Nitrospinota bacterium]
MAFKNLFAGWLVSPVCSLTFVVLLWRQGGGNTALALWFLASLLIPLARVATHIKFNKVADGEFDQQKWENIFLAGAFVSGLVWGSTAIFVFPFDLVANQNFLLLLIAGLSAGASMSYSSLKFGSAVFFFPAFLPNIIRLFFFGDSMHGAMAFVASAFMLAVWGTSRNSFSIVSESLRLRYENLSLISGLVKAKVEAEEATKLKDKFISIISHDLKGPLGSIRGLMRVSSPARRF